MIDPATVKLMCAACDHPHAAEAFLSIFLSPRGQVGVGVMARELAARGMPMCLFHGSCLEQYRLSLVSVFIIDTF
jgi:hypothetical protein